jgi:hypothetical protein
MKEIRPVRLLNEYAKELCRAGDEGDFELMRSILKRAWGAVDELLELTKDPVERAEIMGVAEYLP